MSQYLQKISRTKATFRIRKRGLWLYRNNRRSQEQQYWCRYCHKSIIKISQIDRKIGRFQFIVYDVDNSYNNISVDGNCLFCRLVTSRIALYSKIKLYFITKIVPIFYISFWILGALVIVSYKYSLFFNGNPNQAVNLIPIIVAFSIPLILGLVLVAGRASLNGQLDVSRIFKGDIQWVLRSL